MRMDISWRAIKYSKFIVIMLCLMRRFTYGTSGLLLTEKIPKTYTKEDYKRYKELLQETNVMYRDYGPECSYPRANRSTKWTNVLRPIWEEFRQKGIVHSDDDEKYLSGDGLYLQKNRYCFNVRRNGTGMYLGPRPMLAGLYGNGLCIRRGSSIYDGEGLLLGQWSPFKKIPILGWIL